MLILRAESVVNAGGSREGEGQDISEDESSPREARERGRGHAGRMQATPMHGLHPKDQAAACDLLQFVVFAKEDDILVRCA